MKRRTIPTILNLLQIYRTRILHRLHSKGLNMKAFPMIKNTLNAKINIVDLDQLGDPFYALY